MNFQTVEANNGNMVAMNATVVEVGSSKLNVNQKPFQSVTLRDDNGDQHKVTINKGNGELLDNNALGQRLAFNLSTYNGQHGLGYSGFWNNRAQVNQPTTQQPQQTAQRANATKPNANVSIERQCAWKAACRYCGEMKVDARKICGIAKVGAYFIQTGNDLAVVAEPDREIAGQPEDPLQ